MFCHARLSYVDPPVPAPHGRQRFSFKIIAMKPGAWTYGTVEKTSRRFS